MYDKLEEAFALYEGWGVKGLMVDFMDRNDQEMIRIQEEILECAARHRLLHTVPWVEQAFRTGKDVSE